MRKPERFVRWLPVLVVALAVAACGDSASDTDINIQLARTKPLGSKFTIEGTVTVPTGNLASFTGDEGFAIDDGTAGIYVSVTGGPDLAIGTAVKVQGTRRSLNQMIVVTATPSDITTTGDEDPVVPDITSTGSVLGNIEGSLVTVTGTVTSPLEDDPPAGAVFEIDDGTGAARIFVATSTGIDVPNADVGDVFTITGFVGRNGNDYFVLPRFASDVVGP